MTALAATGGLVRDGKTGKRPRHYGSGCGLRVRGVLRTRY